MVSPFLITTSTTVTVGVTVVVLPLLSVETGTGVLLIYSIPAEPHTKPARTGLDADAYAPIL